MLKKIMCAVLAAALTLSLTVGASAGAKWGLQNFTRSRTYTEGTFSDVSSGWYVSAVQNAYELNLMNGSGNKFNPNKNITVAETIALACKLHSIYVDDDYDFSGGSPWYQKHVEYASKNHIVVPKTVELTSNATRSMFAYIMASAYPSSDALTAINDITSIPDIPSDKYYFKSVLKLYNAGVTKGTDEYGNFKPDNYITRAAVASIAASMADESLRASFTLKTQETVVDTYVPSTVSAPAKPTSTNTKITTVSQSGASGIAFDPAAFKADLVLADGSFFTVESAESMVKRTGATIAFNGAFFNSYTSDYTTWSSMIKDGKALLIDNANPDKPYFVIDSSGKASIQHMTIHQTARIVRDGAYLNGDGLKFEDVGCNFTLGENDGTRMIFTSEYGSSVPGKVKCAAICNADGVVQKVINSSTAVSVSIPKDGFVLCERFRRDESASYKWEKFFDTVKAGDTIALSLSYEGSSVQDIVTAFACGPTVVKDGKAYGNTSTYNAEGFTEAKIVSNSSGRTCLGVKKDGTVVVVTASATMAGLSKIMVALGCVDAMNLDGGASSALYVNGSARVAAGRQLSHMIIFTAG